jgi:excisionase family DNA binding protein
MADSPIEWMSSGDAADYLGIGTRTLYKFIDEDKLTGYKFGRVIRLKRSDVDAFIESCRIEPGTLEHLRADRPHDSTDASDD